MNEIREIICLSAAQPPNFSICHGVTEAVDEIHRLRTDLAERDAELKTIKEGLLAIVKKHTGDMK